MLRCLYHNLGRVRLPNGGDIMAILLNGLGGAIVLDNLHHWTTEPKRETVVGQEEKQGLVAVGHDLVHARTAGESLRPTDWKVHLHCYLA